MTREGRAITSRDRQGMAAPVAVSARTSLGDGYKIVHGFCEGLSLHQKDLQSLDRITPGGKCSASQRGSTGESLSRDLALLSLIFWTCATLASDAPQISKGSSFTLVTKQTDFDFNHSAFQGITLRSISCSSAELISPRIPMVTMPQNMMSTCRSSHEFQIR